jgi:hypothetical protein
MDFGGEPGKNSSHFNGTAATRVEELGGLASKLQETDYCLVSGVMVYV